MQDKDKIILKESAGFLAMFAVGISQYPQLAIPLGLCQSLFRAGGILRQKRALEWVEMVKENVHVFTEDILKDENFQDGFSLYFENFIKERDEDKREYIKRIFLDFTQSSNKLKFPIEDYNRILESLNSNDILNLKNLFFEIEDNQSGSYSRIKITDYDFELHKNLIDLKIIKIISKDEARILLRSIVEDDFHSTDRNVKRNHVEFTPLGKDFCKFLINLNIFKFKNDLVKNILQEKEYSIRRLFDDRKMQVGDTVLLINIDTKKQFGTGVITQIDTRSLRNQIEIEKLENTLTEEEIYKKYEKEYGQHRINPDVNVKIIKLKLL